MDIAPTLPIFKIANLDNLLRIKKFDNAVVFVIGHGSINGLDSELPIKPFLFYKKFQVISKLKKVIFYFGQCYSGVFNQIPLKTHLGLKRFKLPNIIAIGCTGLFPSLSTSVTVENVTWVANIFLIYVFNWISNPIDIDGDGHFSVIDSFKIATFYTNNAITDIKKNDTVQNLLQQNQLTKLISSLSNPTLSRNEQDNIRLEIQALEKMLEIRYITQESWILNTDIAISTYF